MIPSSRGLNIRVRSSSSPCHIWSSCAKSVGDLAHLGLCSDPIGHIVTKQKLCGVFLSWYIAKILILVLHSRLQGFPSDLVYGFVGIYQNVKVFIVMVISSFWFGSLSISRVSAIFIGGTQAHAMLPWATHNFMYLVGMCFGKPTRISGFISTFWQFTLLGLGYFILSGCFWQQ